MPKQWKGHLSPLLNQIFDWGVKVTNNFVLAYCITIKHSHSHEKVAQWNVGQWTKAKVSHTPERITFLWDWIGPIHCTPIGL
eukprot:8938838-Ditylum_brightwellii.AAC.1